MKKRTYPLQLAACLIALAVGCHPVSDEMLTSAGDSPRPEHPTQAETQDTEQPEPSGWSGRERWDILYTEPRTGYTVAASDLLDTLFIAGAAYYEFESDNLLPVQQERYRDVREHFAPYRDHALMEQLAPCMNDFMRDVNGDAVAVVMQYVVSGQVQYEGNPVFGSAEEAVRLIEGLYEFYRDTGAAEFLRSTPLRTEMEAYIPVAAEEFPIASFLTGMEDYTGNREAIYADTPLRYCSVVTPYRPGMASFYNVFMGEEVCFVSQQSPYSMMDGSLDIRQTVETAVHESLHMFLNPGVWERSGLIESLAEGMEPGDVTCPMYYSHPWNRITDEAVVRAVQAGIYRTVYGDGERAFDEILAKEMHAGIQNLDVMYERLLRYEDGRESYLTIDEFLDELIEAYYTLV